MKLPRWSRRPDRTRGQALVEFALILPILVLLVVMAIDFGRVFFSWVSLQNAARIGANYAGQNPDGWEGLGKDAKKDAFEQLISDHVSGCALDPIQDPGFANGYDWGDDATVTLTCNFDVLTPLAGALVGNPVAIRAEAVFPIRIGTFAGPVGGGGGGGPSTCTLNVVPTLVGMTVTDAENEWYNVAGFSAGTLTASPNDPDFLVENQSVAPDSCVDATTPILVNTGEPPVCGAGEEQVPSLLGMTVANAKTAWASDFSGAFKPNNAVDTKTVLTQSTDPEGDPVIGGCVPTTATVTVTWGDPPATPCDVPNMVGSTQAAAELAWQTAGFSTTLKKTGNGASVVQQDPGHPGRVSCDAPGSIKLGNN